jgi:hypothetical protein
MGVDKSTNKKKHDKKKFHDGGFKWYADDDEFVSRMEADPKEKRVVIFDGSIPIETEISQNTTNRGDVFFKNLFTYHIKPYIGKESVPIIVFVMDLHYRPDIKDLDTTRSYDPDAETFKQVNDAVFPVKEDVRNNKLSEYVTSLSVTKTNLSVIMKKIEAAERLGIKKKNENLVSLKEDKHDLSTKAEFFKRQIECLRTDKRKHPIDSWKAGKGNPHNRKMLYSYITQKFIAYLRANLKSSQVFYLDGVVATPEIKSLPGNQHLAPYEYCAMKFYKIVVGQRPHPKDKEKVVPVHKMVIEYEVGAQLGEGEQGMLYYIQKIKEEWDYSRFMVATTDTDIFGYLGLNWRHLSQLRSAAPTSKPGVSVLVRCKNFYYGKTPNEPVKDGSRMYVASFNRIAELIRQMYPSLYNPVFTYYLFWGVFLGNDFIRDVHKTIQKCHSGYREADTGYRETNQFLDYLFNHAFRCVSHKKVYRGDTDPGINRKREKSEAQTRMDKYMKKIKFAGVKSIKTASYSHGVYRMVKLNIGRVLKVLVEYRRKFGIKPFTKGKVRKLIATCLNTQYVANYFMNQYRMVNSLKRRTLVKCDDTDKDGCHGYGYMRDEKTGKVVQSLNIPKAYIRKYKC